MTIELDSVAANAPDNAEGATVRTARYAINAAHASGNITGEQHAEALRKLLMNGHALNTSPAIQAKRQPEAEAWLRRVLVGFGFSFLLTVAVIVMVSLSSGSFFFDIRARVNAATNLTEGLSTMGPPAAVRLR